MKFLVSWVSEWGVFVFNTFCLSFILFSPVLLIRIWIYKVPVPEDGSDLDPDPQHWFLP